MDLVARRQLQKVEDWPRRLIDHLSEVKDKKPEYGVYDCGFFVVGCIEAMTEVDIGIDWRGTYETQAGMMRRVVKAQNKDWELIDFWNWLMGQHGCQNVKINFAHRGDPVFIDDTFGNLGLGIIDLNGREALGVTEEGLITFPKSMILQAWSIE